MSCQLNACLNQRLISPLSTTMPHLRLFIAVLKNETNTAIRINAAIALGKKDNSLAVEPLIQAL